MTLFYALRRLSRHWSATAGAVFLISLNGILFLVGASVYKGLVNQTPALTPDLLTVRLYRNPGPPPELLSYFDIQEVLRSGLTSHIAFARTARVMVEAEARQRSSVVLAEIVNSDYFDALGVIGVEGSTFHGADRNNEAVVVLNRTLAAAMYDQPSAAIGRRIVISNTYYTVIGVTPAEFGGIWTPASRLVQLWIPLREVTRWFPGQVSPDLTDPSAEEFAAVARVSALHYQSFQERFRELGDTFELAQPTHPPVNHRDFRTQLQTDILISPNADHYVRALMEVALALVSSLAVALCLFIVAMCNSYATVLEPQLRIRKLLGATTLQTVLPLVWSFVLIVSAAAPIAVTVSSMLRREISSLFGGDLIGLIRLDASQRMSVVALILSVAAIVAGTAPAIFRLIRTDSNPMRSVVIQRASGRRLILAGLSVAFALAMSAIAGATLRQLSRVPYVNGRSATVDTAVIGIDTTLLPTTMMWPREMIGTYLLSAVRSVPDIHAAWFETLGFFAQPFHNSVIRRVSVEGPERFDHIAALIGVSSDWTSALGTSILAGRDFRAEEYASSAPVALVPASVAKAWWPLGNPVGQRILVASQSQQITHQTKGDDQQTAGFTERMIVGVVRDWVNNPELLWVTARSVIVPRPDNSFAQGYLLVQRSDRTAAAVATGAVQALRQRVPGLPIVLTTDLRSLVGQEYTTIRALSVLFSCLAVVGLVLAIGGVAAIVADDILVRQRELGIRSALGASRSQLTKVVLRRYAVVVSIGTIVTVYGMMVEGSIFDKFILAALLGRPSLTPEASLMIVPLLMAVMILVSAISAAAALQINRLNPATIIRDSLEVH